MSNPIRFSSSLTRRSFVAAAAVLALATAVPAVAADPLDEARNAGTVGERFDGYAVPRDGASAETLQLVQEINAKRKAFYQQKAGEQGVSVNAVQEIYAKTIYDKAPSGWWFLTQSGWSRK